MNVNDIITYLNLKPHPEGGYYRETYRSENEAIFNDNCFQNASRTYYTGIYFLLVDQYFSSWHRIKSDEMWHYYFGTAPLLVHEIDHNNNYKVTELNNTLPLCNPQYMVKAGNWFASEIKNQSGFALVGCTVSPGFDFKDFELAQEPFWTNVPNNHHRDIARLLRKRND
ncbi:MAG: cupin domain-containing protein [Bacteroidota bacterium]